MPTATRACEYLATTYNGIDPAHFTFSDRPGEYLCFLGRFHPEKGTHLAIEIAQARGRAPEDRRDPARRGVLSRAGRAAYRRRPRAVSGRSRARANATSCSPTRSRLVHMTTRPERFGLTTIEAMACGTPVLAANMGSMPEIVVDGVTGFLCDGVDEAVAKVPRLAALDRRACRARVEREFSVERMIDRYLDAYAKALELGIPPPPSASAARSAAPRLVGSPDGLHGDSAQTQESRLAMTPTGRTRLFRPIALRKARRRRGGARCARRPARRSVSRPALNARLAKSASQSLRTSYDLIFLRVDAPRDLARIRRAVYASQAYGALWVFHPKGRGASPTDAEVRSAGIAAGLVDNKISAYSDSHTATRFVIPLALR